MSSFSQNTSSSSTTLYIDQNLTIYIVNYFYLLHGCRSRWSNQANNFLAFVLDYNTNATLSSCISFFRGVHWNRQTKLISFDYGFVFFEILSLDWFVILTFQTLLKANQITIWFFVYIILYLYIFKHVTFFYLVSI